MKYLILLFLAGCSGMQHLGTIDGVDFYSIHSSNNAGPNITSLIIKRPGKLLRVHHTFAGPGIATSMLPAIISGGSYVAGQGVRRPPSHSTNMNQISSDSKHNYGNNKKKK